MHQALIPFLVFLCVRISNEEVTSQHTNGADTELRNSPEVSCPLSLTGPGGVATIILTPKQRGFKGRHNGFSGETAHRHRRR